MHNCMLVSFLLPFFLAAAATLAVPWCGIACLLAQIESLPAEDIISIFYARQNWASVEEFVGSPFFSHDHQSCICNALISYSYLKIFKTIFTA